MSGFDLHLLNFNNIKKKIELERDLDDYFLKFVSEHRGKIIENYEYQIKLLISSNAKMDFEICNKMDEIKKLNYQIMENNKNMQNLKAHISELKKVDNNGN